MTSEEARKETLAHIERVAQLLDVFIAQLKARALSHDASKIEEPEFEEFVKRTGALKGLTYGSDEYKEQLKLLAPALTHHYQNNRHHPEFFDNGINGMNLVDLVELMADWKGATERHDNGDIMKSITLNTDRFGISEQLAQILRNTVELFEGEPKRKCNCSSCDSRMCRGPNFDEPCEWYKTSGWYEVFEPTGGRECDE